MIVRFPGQHAGAPGAGTDEPVRVHAHLLVDRESLAGIRRRIRADLARAGLAPSVAFDCLVAVTEACTNALAGERDGDLMPDVGWTVEPDRVRFYITDFSNAQWHARAAHPSRDPAAEAELERRIAGMGLDLMRRLMDEVDVRAGARGTIVELVKNF